MSKVEPETLGESFALPGATPQQINPNCVDRKYEVAGKQDDEATDEAVKSSTNDASGKDLNTQTTSNLKPVSSRVGANRSRGSSRRSSALFSSATRFTGAHLLATGLQRLDLENGETVLNRLMPKFRNSEQEKRFLDEKVLDNLETSKVWLAWMFLANILGLLMDFFAVPGPAGVVQLRVAMYMFALMTATILIVVYYFKVAFFTKWYSYILVGMTWTQSIVFVIVETKRSFHIMGYYLDDVQHLQNRTTSLLYGCNMSEFGVNARTSLGEPLAFNSCNAIYHQDTTLLLLLGSLVALLSHHGGLRPIENIAACVGVLSCYTISAVLIEISWDFFRTVVLLLFVGVSLYGAFMNELRQRQIFERSLLANKAFYHNRKLRASFDRHIENEQMLIEEADRLEKENQKLRRQSVMTSFRTVELQSPLMQSIKLLEQIEKKEREVGNQGLASQMNQISRILAKSGSDLTSINITAQVDDASVDLDEVTREWLNNTTSTWQKMRNQGRNKNSNFNRNHGVGTETGHMKRKVSSLASTLDLEVQSHMSQMHDWSSFDIFKLSKICPNVITVLMQKIVQNRDLNKYLPLSMSRMMNFTNYLDTHYSYHQCGKDGEGKSNPYHNNEHAADVLQSVECFVFCGDGFDFLGPTDAIALYVAAAVHDFRHIGRTNQFLVQTSHPIAIQHNDQSVLERFHLAEAFKLMGRDENNFLKRLSREQRIEVRQTIVDLVLATDLAQTTEYLSRFQLFLAKCSENPGNGLTLNNNAIATKKSPSQMFSSFRRRGGEKPNTNTGNESNNSDTLLILQIAIKVADIGHPTKPIALHIEWSRRIQEEFFAQGDVERECGMKVAPMCDRNFTDSNKGQMGFIDFVCRPLIEPFSEYTKLPFLMEHLSANYRYWQQRWRRKTVTDQITKPSTTLNEMQTIEETRNGSDARESSMDSSKNNSHMTLEEPKRLFPSVVDKLPPIASQVSSQQVQQE